MMRIPDTELFINPEGRVYHLGIRKQDLADIVLLVGDQDRVDVFKGLFDEIEMEHRTREFHTLTGLYRSKRFTALSTGIGTDNIDIAVNELDALANIDFDTRKPAAVHRSLTLFRLGTCGAIQPDISVGSMILSHKAIGLDNVLNWYADRDKVCDLEMEQAFLSQVHWSSHLHDPYISSASPKLIRLFEDCTVKGLTLSSAGFYGPQGRKVRAGLAMPAMLEEFEAFRFKDWRITNFEMESSALFGLASILGHEAGTLCVAMGNRYHKNNAVDHASLVRKMCELALDRLSL